MKRAKINCSQMPSYKQLPLPLDNPARDKACQEIYRLCDAANSIQPEERQLVRVSIKY